MVPSPSSNAVGIDLGTTYSCVGKFRDGKVTIIPNKAGEYTTASVVTFDNGNPMVGESSGATTKDPKLTVYDAKRMIGRNYSDMEIQSNLKKWPFKVIDNAGAPNIELIYPDGKRELVHPVQVSAYVLAKLKEDSEAFLHGPVTEAVITCPAYFNEGQRQATKDAAQIAHLKVLRIINEPTAAAIAYGLDKKETQERNVLIYDLGGGTFDASILTIDNGVFEVKSTKGNTYLGGRDFDNVIVDKMVEEFKKMHGKDIRTSPKAMIRVQKEAERVKRMLSGAKVFSVNADLDSLYEGIDFTYNLTRAKFHQMCDHFFDSTIQCIRECMQDAKMDKSDIHQVVCVGGSTRIPRVIEKLTQFFDGKEPCRTINPDEAVAVGAAIQAAILIGDQSEEIKDVLLLDVVPLSIGIETAGNILTKLVLKNQAFPCERTQIFTTYADNQTSVSIKVYQGERTLSTDNTLLGQFELSGITPAPRGVPQIEVKFQINNDGILTVTALDKVTQKSANVTFDRAKYQLSPEQIAEAVRRAEECKEQDEMMQKVVNRKNEVENYSYSVSSALQNNGDKVNEAEKSEINNLINNLNDYLGQPINHLNINEIDSKYNALKSKAEPIMVRLSQQAGGAGAQGQTPDFSNFNPSNFAGAAGQQKHQNESGPTVEEVD